MQRDIWTGVLGQRVLFVFLMGLAGMAALGLYRADVAHRAPDIAGYSWGEHPHTLLVAYKKDCGCGPPPETWVQAGLKRRFDVLLVSSEPQNDWSRLRTHYPASSLQTRDNAPTSLLARLSPKGTLVACLVENGRIRRYGGGGDVDHLFAP